MGELVCSGPASPRASFAASPALLRLGGPTGEGGHEVAVGEGALGFNVVRCLAARAF